MIYLYYFLAVSLAYDYIKIEKYKSPITKSGHIVRFFLRAIVILYLAYISDVYMPFWQVLATYTITFWFLFDSMLNIARGRSVLYLGGNAIDKLQIKYGGPFVWFVWKAILFCGLSGIYYFN